MSSILQLIGVPRRVTRTVAVIAIMLGLGLSSRNVSAQDSRDRGDYRDRNGVTLTRLDRGMTIPVRVTESIDARETDQRVFSGVIDHDVRGDDGRLAIPRGSTVELIARDARPGELVIDLESISVDGQRFAVKANSQDVVGTSGRHDIVGSIIGAIRGGRARGETVRVPRDSVISFRLERPLDIGVADRGVNRNGIHYHDYDGRGGRGGR